MATKIMNAQSAVGSTDTIKFPNKYTEATIEVTVASLGAVNVSACEVKLQGSNASHKGARDASGTGRTDGLDDNGLITRPALVIGTTPENVANVAFDYRINGVNYSKAAVAAGTAIGTGYDITDAAAGSYGGFAVYIDAAGTITFQYPAAIMAYTTNALAAAAIDALTPSIGTILIGKVVIFNNEGATWDSQTDNLTPSGDVTTVAYVDAHAPFADIVTHTFNGAEITAQKAIFHVDKQGVNYGRLYLSTLTNAGEVTASIEFK